MLRSPILWVWLVATGCAPAGAEVGDDPYGECVHYSTDPELDAFLAEREAAYQRAVERAARWVLALEVDPVALPAHAKPKKRLGELVDVLIRLHDDGIGDPEALRARVEQLARATDDPAYHDMLDVDDVVFKQNATSYLRVAYLLERFGVALPRYRREIARVHPRLDAHMPSRGAHQRGAFHTYYAHFGLKEPFPLKGALEAGLLAQRADPARMDRLDAYSVTHEIFVPFDFGEDLDAEPYDAEALAWVRHVLAALTDTWVAKGDPDLVAELVSCLRFVRATDLPQYRRGIEMLLLTQAEDGHWGDYERFRRRDGDHVTVKYELHTTSVAIDALTAAFHPDRNRALAPVVP